MKSIVRIYITVSCVSAALMMQLDLRAQVNFFNNGAQLKIDNNALLYIDGNYVNQNDGIQDGTIDLNGNIAFTRNWVNNSGGSVFTNIEPVPNGWVRMIGNNIATLQLIQGINPTEFENLEVSFQRKILENNDNSVRGTLRINAVFDLNSRRFIINNPLPSGIEYVGKNIRSETDPAAGYGIIQWNIGSAQNIYDVPFGTINSNSRDLNLTLTTISAGQPSAGSISFATYPSNIFNQPLPSGTSLFFDPVESVVDRYWHINPDYTDKPAVNLVFRYTNNDIDPKSNFNLAPARLKAMRYNPLLGRWDDWGPFGKANEANYSVSVISSIGNPLGVAPSDFYSDWTLVAAEKVLSDIFIPTAFSPNGDGNNDMFFPVFHPETEIEYYEFHVFNRWGEKIFFTNDPLTGWDGRYKSERSVNIGVYTYLVILKAVGKGEKRYTGHITLLR